MLIRSLILLFFFLLAGGAYAQDIAPDSVLEYHYLPEIDHELIEDRLSCLESGVPLSYDSRVVDFINYFAVKDRPYSAHVFAKAPYYFHIFEEYLKKYNLPDELKYLSIVESGLNPRAISRAGAGGLWQFMPYTGRIYGLHIDWYIDERMDPYQATEAACKYLSELYGIFNDWELALAAYNAGPGNVRRAIRRSGYKKKFYEIYPYLPRETRSYVPQYVAIVYLMNYAEYHNLFIPREKYSVEMDSVIVSDYLHLPTMAQMLDICTEDLLALNPSIKREVLPQDVKNFPLRIPKDRADYFLTHEKQILDSASKVNRAETEYLARNSIGSTYGRKKVVHRVKSGEVLGTIAQRYHVRIRDIRKWNGIYGNLIRSGQRLNIWVHPSDYK
jgi:membrane-bound lytic murein transglycosylase D